MEEQIGIVPDGGYRKNDRHSLEAMVWLKWLSASEHIDIQHARNGGEVHVLNYKVDGQNRHDKNQVDCCCISVITL